MALNIKDAQTDRFVRQLAAATGESITTAVQIAVHERLDRVGVPPEERARQMAAIDEIVARVAELPVLDDRPADEILGYGPDGLPH